MYTPGTVSLLKRGMCGQYERAKVLERAWHSPWPSQALCRGGRGGIVDGVPTTGCEEDAGQRWRATHQPRAALWPGALLKPCGPETLDCSGWCLSRLPACRLPVTL